MRKYIIGILIGLIIGTVATVFASVNGYYNNGRVEIYTDQETQIQYLVVYPSSSCDSGVGVCPRYTSTGNIMYVGSEIVE